MSCGLRERVVTVTGKIVTVDGGRMALNYTVLV